MSTLPPAHGAYLIVEIGNYLLTAICLVVAWRNSRSLFGLMIGSMFLGYALEYSQTTKTPPPYEYTQAIVGLPGNVPLGIVISWGIILFAVWHVVSSLEFGWLRHSLAGGLIAVSLDFLTDPAFVYLGFWIWKEPVQYFGIPFSNFVGWFVIVFTFFVSLRCAFHFFPPEKRPAWFVVLISLVAIVPAFLGFVGLMLAYEWLLLRGPSWITEPRLVALYMVPAAIYVVAGFHQRGRTSAGPIVRNAIDRMAIVVPAYLVIASFVTYYLGAMQAKYPELTIIFPVVALVVCLGFTWPLAHRVSDGSS